MEEQDIERLCRERFEKWIALLRENKCLPIAIIGLPLHEPTDGMRVFTLAHIDRVALRIFLEEAAESVLTDHELAIADG